MQEQWLIAIGLLLVLEGLLPALMPKLWKQFVAQILNKPDASLRAYGFMSMLLGLIWIYIVS